MPITRRQFIQRTGLATAGALLGPSLFENVFVREAMAMALLLPGMPMLVWQYALVVFWVQSTMHTPPRQS